MRRPVRQFWQSVRKTKLPSLRNTQLSDKTQHYLKKIEENLSLFVNLLVKFGTLVLISLLLVFVYRLFQDQGYIIEAFSVPKALDESGYNGAVVARKIQDEVIRLKNIASSVKTDSLQLQGSDEQEINLAVMGIGLSLRSISYQLREMVGRRNKSIRGEITRLGKSYTLTLRITDFPLVERRISFEEGKEEKALDSLLKIGGELILANFDPYRLAVVCYREKRFEESIELVRRILRERPGEASWAYLAWGSVLESQQKIAEATEKFRRSIELDPQFTLGWNRLAGVLEQQGKIEEALAAVETGYKLQPDDALMMARKAGLLYRQEKFEESDQAFKEAMKLDPGNTDILMWWIDGKMNKGDIRGADSLIRISGARLEENANGYCLMALVQFAKGDTLKALQLAYNALQIDPSNPTAIQYSFRGAFSSRNYQKVVELFREINPSNLPSYQKQWLYNLTAMSYNMLSLHDTAFQLIRESIQISPNEGYPFSTLAETFAFQGQLDSTYLYLEKAFQLGMSPANIDLSSAPYPLFAQKRRFRQLFDRYMPKTGQGS